ncbi:MAG: DNA topoisomerase, partial [Nanoarchaeota archaeon]
MNPQQKKTKEEKAVESHFIVTKEDLKHAIEKEVKEPFNEKYLPKKVTEKPIKENIQNTLSVEKKYSKPEKIKSEKIKKKNNIKVAEKYSAPKISLKQTGYELIITEKPQAALKISNALGKTVQKDLNKVPYYELERNGKKIIVACAVGHLFTLKQNPGSKQIPSFDISWTPNYLARKKDFTKRYYDTILKLIKNASSLTIATDYDIEGEVIGMNVMKYLCNQPDASRMKFSTLTKEELENSYENKSAHINWGQAIAGETRHYLDWFYGINLSRALMDAIKTTGKFRIMSIGRVQGPTLNMIVQKEKEIQAFKSEPYWQVFITIDDGIKGLELKYNKDLFDKKELEKFNNLKGKKAKTETKKTEQKLSPLVPFNLTNLQTEAYKFYGITPSRTLQIAQSLYLAGLISYPRTSSQKLPVSIGYEKILKQLAEEFGVEKLI